MSKNPLKEFVALRESLLKRQTELQAELTEINAALGSTQVIESLPAVVKAPQLPAVKRSGKRAKNAMSLKDAVLTATKAGPLAKADILTAVGKLGYQFTAKSPLNSLNTLLYTSKAIKNSDGKFGPR